MASNIAKRWRELSGEGNWENILSPLDIDLRRYLIHYGERVQAVGDAFINEKKSPNYGLSRYTKKDFFSKVGLEKGHNSFKYEVTRFFYATTAINKQVVSGSLETTVVNEKETAWIGYVAVATDEGKAALGRRDILVAWRGSLTDGDWAEDLQRDLVSASDIFANTTYNPQVHKGWHSIYTNTNTNSPYGQESARQQVLDEVMKQVTAYKEEEISITVAGHSMGAAIATLNATDISNTIRNGELDKPVPVTAFVFASPKVGDDGFTKLFSAMPDLHVLRIENLFDPVPFYPLELPSVGKSVSLVSARSAYLKLLTSPHDLEVYLHTVAGDPQDQGVLSFETLIVDRDISLMNKAGDFVKDKYNIVVSWWVEKNKSMVQKDDGSWELKDREEENI